MLAPLLLLIAAATLLWLLLVALWLRRKGPKAQRLHIQCYACPAVATATATATLLLHCCGCGSEARRLKGLKYNIIWPSGAAPHLPPHLRLLPAAAGARSASPRRCSPPTLEARGCHSQTPLALPRLLLTNYCCCCSTCPAKAARARRRDAIQGAPTQTWVQLEPLTIDWPHIAKCEAPARTRDLPHPHPADLTCARSLGGPSTNCGVAVAVLLAAALRGCRRLNTPNM